MVVVCHFDGFLQVVVVHRVVRVCLDLGKDLHALRGVALHDGEFFVGELAWLVQNQVGHGNLADIVERRGAFELVFVGVGQYVAELSFFLEFFGNGFHVERRLFNMVSRTRVSCFDHFGEVDNDFILHPGDAGCRGL